MSISDLLQPELYINPQVAQFIETACSPEIDSSSTKLLKYFKQTLLPADDILSLMDTILSEMHDPIRNYGKTNLWLYAFFEKQHNHRIRVELDVPRNINEVNELLSVARCLALTSGARAVMFAGEMYLIDGQPIIGKLPPNTCYGLYARTSVPRGNVFTASEYICTQDDMIIFAPQGKTIRRSDNHVFGNFYEVPDHTAMTDCLRCLPKILKSLPDLTIHTAARNLAVISKM